MKALSQSARRMLPRLAAELAVIVVGVLIALSADGWAASRNDRRVEATRVRALRDNVEETLTRLQTARDEATETGEALRALASGAQHSSSDFDDLLRDGLLYGPTFSPEINVYDDLKSSGELALLQNTELRQALAKMDATLELVGLHQADLTVVQQLNYDSFIIEELDLVRLLGDYVGLAATDRADSLPAEAARVRNLAVFKLDLVTALLQLYDEATAALAAVEAAMDAPASN
jgi:hypothetical protein